MQLLNAEQQRLWDKYESEIENFVAIKEMDDEMLLQSIVNCSELASGYANNIKHFAKLFDLGAVKSNLLELKQTMESLGIMLREAVEKAKANG